MIGNGRAPSILLAVAFGTCAPCSLADDTVQFVGGEVTIFGQADSQGMVDNGFVVGEIYPLSVAASGGTSSGPVAAEAWCNANIFRSAGVFVIRVDGGAEAWNDTPEVSGGSAFITVDAHLVFFLATPSLFECYEWDEGIHWGPVDGPPGGVGEYYIQFEITANVQPGSQSDSSYAAVDIYANAPPCLADWTVNQQVDSGDFFLFIENFLAGTADADRSGATDSGDFFAFIAAFVIGC